MISSQHVFQQCHYDAFTGNKPIIDTDDVRKERLRVRDELIWLDNRLWPFIASQKWNIHRHRQKEHYVSSYHHIWIETDSGATTDKPDTVGHWQPIVNDISSMWLHYGKSKAQLDTVQNQFSSRTYAAHDKDMSEYYNAFYAHTRIQFYLNATEFRAWLVMTDKTIIDKGIFLSNLKNARFADRVWDAVQPLLGKGFYYAKGDSGIALQPKVIKDHFLKFIKTDRAGMYSGIYKKYEPDSVHLLRENIVPEMQENLRLLVPIYNLMAYTGESAASSKAGLDKLKSHFKRL